MKVTATKEITWDMAHRLDGHEGKCKNLHGHTYKLQVVFSFVDPVHFEKKQHVISNGSSRGMVTDFNVLKSLLNIVKLRFDHKTMLWNVSEKDMKIRDVLWDIMCDTVTVDYRPTAENMAYDILQMLTRIIEQDKLALKVEKIRLYETPTSYVEVIND